ncbi:MAG: hypothetical protein WAM08_00415, partial [Candidatus Acidiferrales bacterium]
MFCPECKAEFRLGFTHCADCDVDLVETLDAINDKSAQDAAALAAPELLWSGVDTGMLEQIRSALDEADIPYNDEPLEARLLYASMRNPLEIWVQKSDLLAAKKILAKIFVGDDAAGDDAAADDVAAFPAGSQPADVQKLNSQLVDLQSNVRFVQETPGRSQSNLFAALRKKQEPDAHDPSLPAPEDESADSTPEDGIEDNWDPNERTIEIWGGNQDGMAQILRDCLSENGIAARVARDAAESERLFVHPE